MHYNHERPIIEGFEKMFKSSMRNMIYYYPIWSKFSYFYWSIIFSMDRIEENVP